MSKDQGQKIVKLTDKLSIFKNSFQVDIIHVSEEDAGQFDDEDIDRMIKEKIEEDDLSNDVIVVVTPIPNK